MHLRADARHLLLQHLHHHGLGAQAPRFRLEGGLLLAQLCRLLLQLSNVQIREGVLHERLAIPVEDDRERQVPLGLRVNLLPLCLSDLFELGKDLVDFDLEVHGSSRRSLSRARLLDLRDQLRVELGRKMFGV